MKATKEISKEYREQFDSKCEGCKYRKNPECSFSGMQLEDVKFDVYGYFKLIVPVPSGIPCPVFAELKKGYDEAIMQVVARLVLEHASKKDMPFTLTATKPKKKEEDKGVK